MSQIPAVIFLFQTPNYLLQLVTDIAELVYFTVMRDERYVRLATGQ